MKKVIGKMSCCLLMLLLGVFTLASCNKDPQNEGYQKNPDLDTSKEVSLTIAGNKDTWAEMDSVIAAFEKIYPNCTVNCEFIENYLDNLPIRLAQTTDKIDIFRTTNIQETTEYREYALNLISEESKKILSLEDCHKGLVENFKYLKAENTQYAVPFGGEMRGFYVNVTLLDSLDLEVPTNRQELLDCCQVLLDNGYIPLQSSVSTFAQQFLYPYVCNIIVNGGNYEEMYAAIENIEPGISEYFRDVYAFLYDIVEKGYFDYSRVEDELKYTFGSNDLKAKEFLSIVKISDEVYEKQDDIGKIAFMPDTQAFELYLNDNKADYHSQIEYKFITSPVGVDGGYAYLSPADGMAINKNSDNVDWALEFLNFLFYEDTMISFAEASGKIPNTKDALLKFDAAPDHCSDVGQVTFSYQFYKTITKIMIDGYPELPGISKMTKEKYMKDNGDGTYSIQYTLEDYMSRLEADFQAIKASREE